MLAGTHMKKKQITIKVESKKTTKILRQIIEQEIDNVAGLPQKSAKYSKAFTPSRLGLRSSPAFNKLKVQLTNNIYTNRKQLLEKAFKKLIDDKDVLEISGVFFKGDIYDRTENPFLNYFDKKDDDERSGFATRATNTSMSDGPFDPEAESNEVAKAFGLHAHSGIHYPKISREKIFEAVDSTLINFIPKKFEQDLFLGRNPDVIRKKFPNLILILRDIAFYKTIFERFSGGESPVFGVLIHELTHSLYLPARDGDEPMIPRMDGVGGSEYFPGSWNAESFATRKSALVLKGVLSKIPSLIKTLSRAYRIKAPNWQNISGHPGEKQFVELQKDLERSLNLMVTGEIAYYKQSQAAAKTGEGSFDPALSNYGFKVADFDRGLGNSISSIIKSKNYLKEDDKFLERLNNMSFSSNPPKNLGPTKFGACTKEIFSKLSKRDYNAFKIFEYRWTGVLSVIKDWESTLLNEYKLPMSWVKTRIFNLLLQMVKLWSRRFTPIVSNPSNKVWTIDAEWSPTLPVEWLCILKKFNFKSQDPNDLPFHKKQFKKWDINQAIKDMPTF